MTPFLSGDCEGSDRSPRFQRKIALRSSRKCPLLVRGAFCVLLLLAVCVIPFAFGQQTRAPSSNKNPNIVCNQGWQPGADMPNAGVRMVGVFDGQFYAMGGRSMDGVGNDFTHPFGYDPRANTWTIRSATFPDNQVSDMACGVLNDSGTSYIYCVGGSAGGQTTATDRVFRYNPLTEIIEMIASPWPGDSDGLTLPGGFTVFNNKLYILGGFRINTAMTNTIWEFTPTTNVWVQKNAVLPVARGYIPTAAVGNFIYTGGGSSWNGTTLVDTNDSFRYDPIADFITTIPNIPRATGETQGFSYQFPEVLPEQLAVMWVMGGGRTPPNPSHEIDVYTPFTGWSGVGGGFITPRRNFATASDGGCFAFGCTSYIWLAGGYGSDGTPLSSTEVSCQGPTPTPTATATPTATPSPTPTPMGCYVTSPACGIIVPTQPTDFIIDLSDPVDPVSVQPSDFTVNGTPANADAIINGNTTISFHFNTSPVVQGQNTMHIPACAFNCGNGCVQEFTCTFTYQPSTPTPTPTQPPPSPTATATPTATPTLTPRPSPTPRFAPTPKPRPTPAPRP